MDNALNIAILGDLTAEDDFLHEVQEGLNYVETNLFYFAGTTSSGKAIGGIIRVGNHPNQGHADGTTLLFLGDGSALFNFAQPKIVGNSSWKAGAWDMDVITPGGVAFSSKYDGAAFHFEDPHILSSPKLAFKQPKRKLALDFTHLGKSPMVEFKYNRDTIEEGMEAISQTKGLHQLTSFSGTFALDDGAVESVEGFGWRDHNWGPRNWQAFPKHAFYTGNFGLDTGFVLFQTEGGKGYFMHEGPDKAHNVVDINMVTQYREDGLEPVSMRSEFTLDNGKSHVVEGECVDFIPLRNRREEMTTHLGYSLWHYALDGDPEGMGIAEHMAQSKSSAS